MQAVNTYDCPGGDAPGKAQVYYRVAYMRLINGNWACEGTGTGW